jgi:hypothetical protein
MTIIIDNITELRKDCDKYKVTLREVCETIQENIDRCHGTCGYHLSELTERSFTFDFVKETKNAIYLEYVGLWK